MLLSTPPSLKKQQQHVILRTKHVKPSNSINPLGRILRKLVKRAEGRWKTGDGWVGWGWDGAWGGEYGYSTKKGGPECARACSGKERLSQDGTVFKC